MGGDRVFSMLVFFDRRKAYFSNRSENMFDILVEQETEDTNVLKDFYIIEQIEYESDIRTY